MSMSVLSITYQLQICIQETELDKTFFRLSTLTFESGHPVALLPIYYCYSTYCLLQKLSKYLLTTYLLFLKEFIT